MKMFYKYILVLLFIISAFSSCVDFLNQIPDSVAYSDDEIFTDYTKSLEFVNQLMIPFRYFDDNDVDNRTEAWMYVGNTVGVHGKSIYGLRERITDNCIANQQYIWVAQNYYRDGNFVNSNNRYWAEGSEARFETIWKAIRIANISIKNVHRIHNLTPEQEDKILGMAYFLRAHFYFMLLQGWGGMPYITEPLDPEQNLDLKRESYIVTAQKIAQDFETSAAHLPLIINDEEWGRPTKMAAKAYKAKALIWAASPFANPQNDQSLWQDAAIACAEAIKMAEESNYYKLIDIQDFKKLFVDCDEETLKEIIFGRLFNNYSVGFSPYYCGIKSTEFGKGEMGGESVTENLAQSFPWNNGEPIDPNSEEYKHYPYTGNGINHTGRDPRFYHTILYNGAETPQVSAKGRKVQIWNKSYDNAKAEELQLTENEEAVNGYTFTGYYNWKLFSDAYVFPKQSTTNIMWNYIRMADLYLYYAEAANRTWGPTGTPNGIAGFNLTAVDALNKVRQRAGMPVYNNASPHTWLRPGSMEEFEMKIRNESRIETAFEEKRFYDLRRWRMMLDPDVQTMYGMYIEQTAAGQFTYTVVPLSSNYNLRWQEHHYLFKIKPGDTYLGPNFEQNPGW